MKILDRPYWVNLAYLLPAVTSAVLAWQASVIWNDLSDREWDSPGKRGRVLPSGIVPVSALKEASIVLACTSLAASLLLSVQMFAVMAASWPCPWYIRSPAALQERPAQPAADGRRDVPGFH
jgi:4-hydroxybenzoate polyprenyltransferase